MREAIIRIIQESANLKLRFGQKNAEVLSQVVKLIVEAFKAGNKLLLFGNGGSAADAQHIAAEFVNRYLIERPPLPAIALTTDTSILTSISNDYSFQDIFVKQIKALAKAGDVAIGISTSGRSVNVLKGIKGAKEMGLRTIALVGGDGGELAKIADEALIVESASTPRIQEVHITIGHIICEMVDLMLFQKPL
ncbi:MAG: D-sedoheptulose-7-phosphate isomerase [Thermodesulfobacteriota bacterium]